MFLLKDLLLFSYLTVLIAGAAVKIPTKTGWTSSASKSVYSRALGPPVGMDTITVPFMPKSPFFPKFVDPKMMISKKTDLLSNIFGGLGPVYPAGFKPYMPYGASGPSLYSAADETQMLNTMGKNSADGGNGAYKRGIFGPFSAKPFGPMSSMSPKFGPMSKYSSLNTIPDYSMGSDFSRKRRSIDESSVAKLRSIMDDSKPETKNLGPPPPYPTLAPISEEPEDEVNVLLKKMGGGATPKEYLPGMFGPFGPVVDPSMFIAKKTAFLDTLFKNLATSTTPSPIEAVTETSTAKSTIVPPDFWLPTSVIPGPTEYNEKVQQFLDKLFDTLKINKTAATNEDESAFKNDFARSATFDEDIAQSKVARSAEDLSSINAAKDTIVDTILSELGDLKGNMVTTMNDLITYEKSASTPAKKPFKSFGPGMWPGMKPVPNGMLPFQQKMAILSQVFDMLTDLQKNITSSIQNIIKAKMGSVTPQGSGNYPFLVNDVTTPINMSLLDAIKSRLDAINYGMPMSYNPSFDQFEPKMVRALSKGPGSFWVSYPEDAANIKRQVDSDTESLISKDADADRKQMQARSVKMQMHQGYQSLPAGATESVQAGGGSVPGHQGGGIKLFDANNYDDYNQWVNWVEYMKNDYQGHRHHNHH